MAGLLDLIARAPWREAVTYRDTWPHEYVVVKKDTQRELLESVCVRLARGEGVKGHFFTMTNDYLFIGDYKYWVLPPCGEFDLESSHDVVILNRARLYRDRRDFIIKPGDTGRREDYPGP